MFANRTQTWVARGVVAGALVLLAISRHLGPGAVATTQQGNATVYSYSPQGSVVIMAVFGGLATLACVLAVLFWMQRGAVQRGASVELFLLASGALVVAPSGRRHCVVVTRDRVFHRVGLWFSSTDTELEFNSLSHAWIVETDPGHPGRRTYELQCRKRGGGELVAIPIYDLLKAALPEVLRRAAQRGVVVGQIPPELNQ
jgi:hypothetical protein